MAEEMNLAENMSEEELADARKLVRTQMRENFSKWMDVSDEDATDEDIAEAKKAFEDEVAIYKDKTYLISNDENAVEFAEFLKYWNENCNQWVDAQWKGVIELDKVLTAKIDELKADPKKPFEIDYATLFYLYNVMANPTGKGLASAKQMAEFENYDLEKNEIRDNGNYVTYSHILQDINGYIKELSVADKKLKLLRERVNIAIAGIKISWKITELEEFIELHDAWLEQGAEDAVANA